MDPFGWRRAVAVVAHPDDESFGLGAVLTALQRGGTEVSVLCFTHGEASTLHGVGGDLRAVRAAELERAAAALGIGRCELLDYADGGLAGVRIEELIAHVTRVAGETSADGLVVFDRGGITGHPDHDRATDAALATADRVDLGVVAWALPEAVARRLNEEFGTSFAGRADAELDVCIEVDRSTQHLAIAEHRSQATDNPVLRRRLELLGDREWLRILR